MIAEACADLTAIATQTPSIALALAGAWLHPLHVQRGDGEGQEAWWDMRVDSDVFWGPLNVALDRFPCIYAEFYYRLWAGQSKQQLDEWLLQAFSDVVEGEVYDLESLAYGPPLEFLGLEYRENVEGDQGLHGRTWACLDMILGDDDRWRFTGFGDYLKAQFNDERANWVEWAFGISENSLLDHSMTEYGEMNGEYPDWDSLDYIIEVQEEADRLFEPVPIGLDKIEADIPAYADAVLFARMQQIQERFTHDRYTRS